MSKGRRGSPILLLLVVAVALLLGRFGINVGDFLPGLSGGSEPALTQQLEVNETGEYTTKEAVAQYIRQYGRLPRNFITKEDARKLGWDGGSLEGCAPGKSIGGDHFGNYEGLLPEKKGRRYTECDIDTKGSKTRGAKRIVFSDDGLIYYTDDHYDSFVPMHGED